MAEVVTVTHKKAPVESVSIKFSPAEIDFLISALEQPSYGILWTSGTRHLRDVLRKAQKGESPQSVTMKKPF